MRGQVLVVGVQGQMCISYSHAPAVVPGASSTKLWEIVLAGAPLPLHNSSATKSPAPI